ncbi:hypothetical protein CR513_00988, partial [Mucuna pruriens]
MSGCRPADTPIDLNKKLCDEKEEVVKGVYARGNVNVNGSRNGCREGEDNAHVHLLKHNGTLDMNINILLLLSKNF